MLELTIKDVVYKFNFGMGFLHEINKSVAVPVEGLPGVKKNIGLQYAIAGVIEEDLEALVDVLDAANKNQNPRITRNALDAYIDDENTDIDALFAKVIDFLKSANATKSATKKLLKVTEEQRAKQEAQAAKK